MTEPSSNWKVLEEVGKGLAALGAVVATWLGMRQLNRKRVQAAQEEIASRLDQDTCPRNPDTCLLSVRLEVGKLNGEIRALEEVIQAHKSEEFGHSGTAERIEELMKEMAKMRSALDITLPEIKDILLAVARENSEAHAAIRERLAVVETVQDLQPVVAGQRTS